jgi:hypothetical protein
MWYQNVNILWNELHFYDSIYYLNIGKQIWGENEEDDIPYGHCGKSSTLAFLAGCVDIAKIEIYIRIKTEIWNFRKLMNESSMRWIRQNNEF